MTDLMESAHRVEGPRAAGGRLMREGVEEVLEAQIENLKAALKGCARRRSALLAQYLARARP